MDLLSLVREGRDQELDESLGKVEIKANSHDESEEAAECRKEVFGQTAWSSGMTLLLWAVEASNLEIEKRIALVATLVKYYPALIETGDSQGATPLHYAALNGDLPIAKFLLAKGAQSVPDSQGETPLHLACLNGHLDIVKLFVELGLDPNTRCVSGSTPLHYAVVNGQLKVANILLSHPAVDLSIVDEAGKTAKDLAEAKGNKQLLDCFDSEKRVAFDRVAKMNEAILAHETQIRALEEAIKQDEASMSLVNHKLFAQNHSVRERVTKVQTLQSKVSGNVVRSDESYEIEYQEVMFKLNEQRAKNRWLEEQLANKQLQNSIEANAVKGFVLDAHRNLSNLIALMDTANIALVNTKTEIDSLQPVMRIPQQESALDLVEQNQYHL